jgi:hypothetical protein
MTISRNLDIRKIWFRLLVFVIIVETTGILITMIIFLSPFSTPRLKPSLICYTANSTIIHLVQHPDCHAFNPHVTPQHLFQTFFSVLNDSAWLKRPTSFSPSFRELHDMLFGPKAPNLYTTWPNYFNKTLDSTYPHTSLWVPLFADIVKKQIDIPITFIVEVGSFMGKSSTNIVKSMLSMNKESKFILLCIDTWLGGLEHWERDKMRRLMGFAYGRPIVYEKFMANIIGNKLMDYVIPYSTTSILGARFLLEKKLFPQIIYLDSAHLQGETYVELELYWSLLQTGGLLIGDDWIWNSVRCDVLRFTYNKNVEVTALEQVWFIKKKQSF